MIFFALAFLLSALTIVMTIRAIVSGVKGESNTGETLGAVISFALLNMMYLYLFAL